MFGKLSARIHYAAVSAVANLIARRIDAYYENHTLVRLLNERHTGASPEWVRELAESRGRHALVAAHH